MARSPAVRGLLPVAGNSVTRVAPGSSQQTRTAPVPPVPDNARMARSYSNYPGLAVHGRQHRFLRCAWCGHAVKANRAIHGAGKVFCPDGACGGGTPRGRRPDAPWAEWPETCR